MCLPMVDWVGVRVRVRARERRKHASVGMRPKFSEAPPYNSREALYLGITWTAGFEIN